MDFELPDNLLYTDEHEWIDPDTGWMGITDFAQDELGDIVFVDLPDLDQDVQAMDPFMVIESVKAVSDIYAPADGTIADVNETLVDNPEQINESPYDDGKLAKINVESKPDNLMDVDKYTDHIQ